MLQHTRTNIEAHINKHVFVQSFRFVLLGLDTNTQEGDFVLTVQSAEVVRTRKSACSIIIGHISESIRR